ncbi:hypothetical protein [Ruminococcus bromii]|uniref:hypothetical protein n=1 Tax=Ruminococcus bromii TaxID=40518 RepID=UPI00241C6AA6|nr:hypothetical protein [Ruminococcus bromii]
MDKNTTKRADECTTNTPTAPESVLIMDLRNKLCQLANYPNLSPTIIEMAFGEVYKSVQNKALTTVQTEYENYRKRVDEFEKEQNPKGD